MGREGEERENQCTRRMVGAKSKQAISRSNPIQSVSPSKPGRSCPGPPIHHLSKRADAEVSMPHARHMAASANASLPTAPVRARHGHRGDVCLCYRAEPKRPPYFVSPKARPSRDG